MDAGIPTLETPRLRLRAFREADLEPLFDLLQDPIDPENTASIAVATRLGESLQGETELRGHRVLVYGISHRAWESQRSA